MLQNGRKSIFLTAAERGVERLGLVGVPRALWAWYDGMNERFRRGVLGRLFGEGYDRLSWQYRLRRHGMRMREQSLLVRLRRTAGRYLLESRVGYVGLWLLVSGLSLLILSLILGHGQTGLASLRACVLLLLLSVPLLGSTRSLSRVLRESRVVGAVFFNFCGRCADELGACDEGRARPMGVLLGALLTALLGVVLSPWGLCLLLALTPVLLLLFSTPELSLLLFLAAFPVAYLTGHPTAVLCLLAFLVQLSYLLKVYCGRRELSVELADVPVLLFCLMLLFGGVLGYGEASEGILLSLLASLYFPAVHLLSVPRWRRRAVAVLLAGALLCSLLGIYQYFFEELPVLWVDAERFSDLGGRVTGVFENPNVLGVYLLLLFPMAASVALTKERAWMRWLALPTLASILFCAVLTWSRGAWLAILTELFLLLLLSGKRTAALCLLSPVALFAAIPFLPSALLHRFASIGSLADSSIRYRLYTWRGVLRMIGEHPFGIGVGEAAFRRVYPRYAVSGIESVMHAHQLTLQLTAELGAVGALTLGVAFVFLICIGIGRRNAYGGAFALCGAAVMGLFDHLWYAKGMIALLFIMAAFARGGRENR